MTSCHAEIHVSHCTRSGERLKGTHAEGHPGDGLVLGDLGALEKGEGELVCVEGECEDGTRRSPGADHEMMDRHIESFRRGEESGRQLAVVVVKVAPQHVVDWRSDKGDERQACRRGGTPSRDSRQVKGLNSA